MELVYDGGLANTGVSGNEDQFRPTVGYNTIERGKQGLDLGCSSAQFFGNQQQVRNVMFAKRKFVDATLSFPLSKTPPKTQGPGRS